jgi:anti-sigma factor RsiW
MIGSMNTSPCDLLEGFLGKWLTAPEWAEFQAHLADCPRCRVRLDEQERLNRLLAEAVRQFTPVPPGLVGRVERRLSRARRRRLVGWTGGIAAALLAGCFAIWWNRPPSAEERAPPRVADAPTPSPLEVRAPAPQVRVRIVRPAEVIAVPRKTDNPAVTIIWVYPAVQTLAPGPTPAGSSQPLERSGR